MRKEIYNEDKYKSQIQNMLYAVMILMMVYTGNREKATLKKYIGYNNKYFINGFVFDVDHEYGAIAWDMAGLPKPNAIIQNTINGHAHLLYALKIPVLKQTLQK
nr:replication initiation protein [Escherichia coli]